MTSSTENVLTPLEKAAAYEKEAGHAYEDFAEVKGSAIENYHVFAANLRRQESEKKKQEENEIDLPDIADEFCEFLVDSEKEGDTVETLIVKAGQTSLAERAFNLIKQGNGYDAIPYIDAALKLAKNSDNPIAIAAIEDIARDAHSYMNHLGQNEQANVLSDILSGYGIDVSKPQYENAMEASTLEQDKPTLALAA